jgi:N-acetylneuraminic acid mutarotase
VRWLGPIALGAALLAAPTASTASWESLPPSPIERTEVGAGRIGDRIYVVGGYVAPGVSTGRMTRYDISNGTWREVEPLPIAVNHPGATAHRGHLYVLGGFRDTSGATNRFYRYDPERDRWKRLPDAPSSRGALGFVGIAGRLYAAGGHNGATGELRTLEIYDIDRRRWSEGPPMPTGRNHVGAAVFKRGILVTGGRTDAGTNLDVVERYYRGRDPGRRRWGTGMPDLGIPRSGHAAATVKARPVVFGGEQLSEGTNTISEVEVFDARKGGWVPVASMPTPRHGLGGVAFGNRAFALDGGPRPGYSFSNALEALSVTP